MATGVIKQDKTSRSKLVNSATLSDLQTNLYNLVNSSTDTSEMIAVRILPGFDGSGFTKNTTYGGYAYNIYKENGTTNYFSVILSNNIGEDMFIGYNNGNWLYKALNKRLTIEERVSKVTFNHTDVNGETYTEFQFNLTSADTLGYNQYLLRFNHRAQQIHVFGKNASTGSYSLLYQK